MVRKKVRNVHQLGLFRGNQLRKWPQIWDALSVAKVGVVGSNPIARSN
jgi:hypothetical protein